MLTFWFTGESLRRLCDSNITFFLLRVLNAALGYEAPPSRTPDEVNQLANVCNSQKYLAKMAGDDSSNLYFMHFIKSAKSKAMRAAVMGIYEFNLEVVLIDTGHSIKIFYKVSSDGLASSLEADNFVLYRICCKTMTLSSSHSPMSHRRTSALSGPSCCPMQPQLGLNSAPSCSCKLKCSRKS